MNPLIGFDFFCNEIQFNKDQEIINRFYSSMRNQLQK